MHCAYHPMNAATTGCSGCSRPLCASCDHRIKGYPHCEDCIVRGVEVLRHGGAVAGPWPGAPNATPTVPDAPRPRRAVFFGLFPGLGAVYNRQNLKALAHFLGVVALGQTADVTGLGGFGFAAAGFYIYTLIDAHRTARQIAAGLDPREDEARLKWVLARYRTLWGVFLCLLAVLVVLSALPMPPLSERYVWAGILFLAGAYFIMSYVRGARVEDPGRTLPPAAPRSVVAATLTEDLGHETFGERRAGNR